MISNRHISESIRHVKYMRISHVDWAEYFEENPKIEKKYVNTGEWDSAEKHREYIEQYNQILKILHFAKVKINKKWDLKSRIKRRKNDDRIRKQMETGRR